MSLSSRRPRRTLVPLLPSCKAIVQVETRSLCSRFSMPFFGVKPPPLLCSRRPHRTFIPLLPSCRAIVQVETRSLCSRFSMPFFGVKPPPLLCSRRPHRTFIPLLPSRRVSRAGSSSRDTLFALRFSMPFFSVRPPPLLCSRRPHRTFIYRSCHRAGRLFKSRRARCALTVLDALSNIGRDEALTERTDFASVALQRWPFAKLAPKSSKTSDVGAATRISLHTRVSRPVHVIHDAYLQRRRRRHVRSSRPRCP
jgi:hypothetical protein